jgi:hypothetical protein
MSVEVVKTRQPMEWIEACTIQDQILDCLRRHPIGTHKIIRAEVIGATSTICQTLEDLVFNGLIECGKTKDPASGRTVKAFRIKG